MGFSVSAPGGGTQRGPQPSPAVPAVPPPSPFDDAVSGVLHTGGVPVDSGSQLAWLGYPLPGVWAADLGRLHICPQGGEGVGEPVGAGAGLREPGTGPGAQPPQGCCAQPRHPRASKTCCKGTECPDPGRTCPAPASALGLTAPQGAAGTGVPGPGGAGGGTWQCLGRTWG